MEWFILDRNKRNHLTVCKKMSSGSFKNVIDKMYLEIIYIYTYTYIKILSRQ